ncbi:PocR ligand-binding domain-containing protein [Clostridium sp.]|uniref:PocR ligand-binding domain-containing protein n=1 Tax=Clostridium sp. TaxID=1506 RepID=UPI00284AC174|nr:PocR ligand-binding domain-containing protein [Clostridium sp.]MDR3595383.1 PocR ligand-binding domain-containing protein [Clostridium sp.]
MNNSTNYESWLESINLSDILDINLLQKFQDDFAKNFGISCITFDTNGKPLTKVSNPTEFCEKYTRCSKIGNSRCNQCDLDGLKQSIETGKVFIYKCHTGLVDFAVPIIIARKHLGGIYGGQVAYEKLEENIIRKISRELGIDENEYLTSANKVNIISTDKIQTASNILYTVGNTLAQIGFKQFLFKKMFETLKINVEQSSSILNNLSTSATEVSKNQQNLNSEIKKVDELSCKINKISEFIKQIAKETNMLGLNAAIEASRAGTAGNGFNIVANEIRKLSDKSKETVNNIVETNVAISKSLNNTQNLSESTLDLTEKQTSYIREVAETIQEVLEMANSLNNI